MSVVFSCRMLFLASVSLLGTCYGRRTQMLNPEQEIERRAVAGDFSQSDLLANSQTLAMLLFAMNAPIGDRQSDTLSNPRSKNHQSPSSHSLDLKSPHFSRRALLAGAAALPVGLQPRLAEAAEEDIDVYFGCGCFWHVQHEFVEAERRILGRSDMELTARVGYAGGKGAQNGKVCYHNANRIGEYGDLGHAEVVRVKVPPSKFGEFANEYFKLFDARGERADQFGDRGLEYRNLVGIPGGSQSPLMKVLEDASKNNGDRVKLAVGKGSDPDKVAETFVMDTEAHPFFIGEPYHQFHDGFARGENYPDSYNGITRQLIKANLLSDLGCPNGYFA